MTTPQILFIIGQTLVSLSALMIVNDKIRKEGDPFVSNGYVWGMRIGSLIPVFSHIVVFSAMLKDVTIWLKKPYFKD